MSGAAPAVPGGACWREWCRSRSRPARGDFIAPLGDTVIEQTTPAPQIGFGAGPEDAREPDIAGVQWGKLLVDLNNALNALADLPLRQQLRSGRGAACSRTRWRKAWPIRAEGIKPVSSTPVPAGLTPHLLRLPDPVFALLLGSTMKIDPDARSSMWEDLQRGRREIDYLQGLARDRRPPRLRCRRAAWSR
jgi:2-dehydropantoate 2-reductase